MIKKNRKSNKKLFCLKSTKCLNLLTFLFLNPKNKTCNCFYPLHYKEYPKELYKKSKKHSYMLSL